MLVIVPSRGRPKNIIDLIESWKTTRTGADLLICIDDDDPEYDAYRAITRPPWAMLVHNERLRLGPTLNKWATQMMTEYRMIGFMGDDHRPRTAGWDKRFYEVLGGETGLGVAYGNDLIQGENIPTAVMLTSNIVRALGRMVPVGLVHMYLDNYWRDLGEALGRRTYCNDVIIEHMHPIAGKAEWDAGYREVNSSEIFGADGEFYQHYVADGKIRADADEVLRYCGLMQ